MMRAKTPPRLLLAAAYCWDSTVPLAIALRNAGFDVAVVAPAEHPIHGLAGLCGHWRYRPLRPLSSLRRAIEAAEPSIVMPCDEPMMVLLRRLHLDRKLAPRLHEIVTRSLGAPRNLSLIASRTGVADVAASADVLAPRSACLGSLRDLSAWLTRYGTPAYLKIDRSTGGRGVIRVDSATDATLAYLRLRLLFGWPRLVWLWARSGDLSSLPLLTGDAPAAITVQKAIEGVPANCAIAAWQGRMLACVSVEALKTSGPTGVATVVRVRDDPLMVEAARKVTAALGFSGLYGLDFVLARDTGEPWLIEINGRPTQTSYLRLGPGADLAGAFYAAATGSNEEPIGTFRAQQIIALFHDPNASGVHAKDLRIAAPDELTDSHDPELQPVTNSAVAPS